MIITYLIIGFLSFVGAIFSLFPTVSALPAGMSDSLASVFGYIVPFNFIIPLDTLVGVLGIILTFELGYLFFKIVMYIYKLIPFVG
jgi:hypothetical protein